MLLRKKKDSFIKSHFKISKTFTLTILHLFFFKDRLLQKYFFKNITDEKVLKNGNFVLFSPHEIIT